MKRLIILILLVISSTAIFAQSVSKSKYKKEHLAIAKAKYTCTMHPEITSTKPGKCAKCGMKLVKAKPVTYTCPMHPQVVSNDQGKCSKCGMTLEAKKDDNNSKMKM